MERRELLSTFDVTNTSDSPSPAPNSLRWAILQVDADTSVDTIDFDIPGSGVQSISLTSALPAITNSVVIDGTSQPNFAGVPLIQIDGTSAGAGAAGLVISAGGSTVEGLALVGFSGSAISITTAGNNEIQENYLGISAATGHADKNGEGISISGSSNNTIGSTTAGAGNLISGNGGAGIDVNVIDGPSSDNLIVGNLIGTGPSGLTAIGNGGAGISIAGASTTQIGTPATNFSNVVSGNAGPGIEVTSAAVVMTIQNNAIGVGIDGQTIVGNRGDGILWDGGPGGVIGGADVYQGNVIGGNQGNGIETTENAAGFQVFGNFIGTDALGLMLNLANRENGIQLASSSNVIGSSTGGGGNTIDFNGSGQVGSGVQLMGSANENEILSNSIYGNSGLGINLGAGPTPNHAPGTPGPNDFQNYPSLTSVQSDGTSTTITGSLYSAPNSGFLLQFFASPTGDASGFGQGKTLIGAANIETNSAGNATFTLTINNGTTPGAFVSATATDPSGNTSEFSEDVHAQGEINLNVSATATPSPVASGGELTYTINVTNSGTLAATGVVISDQLPSQVTKISASITQGIIIPIMSNSTVTASVGSIAAGSTVTLTIVVDTNLGYIGTITDSASASCQQTNPASSALNATVNTQVVAETDMAVALSASPNPVLAGGDLTDTITISNLGPEAATGVTATLPIAAGMTVVSASSGAATVTSDLGQLIVFVGSMAANTQVTVSVVVEPTIAGPLEQTVTVSSNAIDSNPSNNTSSIATQVIPATDLVVTITPSASSANPDSEFDYVVEVTNNGPSEATGVVLLDTLPTGVSYGSATSPQGWLPTYANGVVSLPIATLGVGGTTTMTIVTTPTASPGSMLVDSASASGQQTDPDMTDNSASVSTPMVGVSDLGIAAAPQPAEVYVGQDVTYTLTVSNQGPNDEPDAVVTCPLPSDVAFASASYEAGWSPTLALGMLTADLGPLASGATAVVTIVLVPQAAAVGTFTTSFSIQGQNADLVPANNTAFATMTVDPAADLEITISPTTGPASVQAQWNYTLTVTNLGLSNATGVMVTAPLPSGVQFVSASSKPGTTPVVLNGTLSDELGTIKAGGTVTITVGVIPDAIETLALAATVTGSQFDPNMANNTGTFTESVAPSVNLAVALVPNTQRIVTGQPLTMMASIQNTGPNPATSVVLCLPMGSNLLFVSSQSSVGSAGIVNGQFIAQLGELDPGASAEIRLVVMPQVPGTITSTASVTAEQNQLNPGNATASTTVTVLESAGTLQFGGASYSVANTAGSATISVLRTVGSLGAVMVNFTTIATNATPGLDFVPTSGTLTFATGQTVGTIVVPVLNDPWENHNDTVDVVLSSPTGGATLGSLSTAQLTIIDTDPDTTPPQVSQLTWSGTSKAITSVNLTFTAPLASSFANDAADYRLNATTAGQPSIPIAMVSYNPATYTVTVVPSVPLASNRFYQIVVVGSGTSAIRDLAGNMLDGAFSGLAGTNYVASFGQGTKLSYVDQRGNKVSVKLSGGGYLQDVIYQGEGQALTVIGERPRRTVLSGTVKKVKRSGGTTNLGMIRGLGNFGEVRVTLKTPPFLVKQYPFIENGRGKL
jgi:uncharacterized repeat protein (TIGR01451 family)